MTPEELARRGRAARRVESMSVRKGNLGQPETDFSPVTGAEAISLLTQLTRESFSLAGLAAPEYPRERIPVRFVPRSR